MLLGRKDKTLDYEIEIKYVSIVHIDIHILRRKDKTLDYEIEIYRANTDKEDMLEKKR